MSPVAPGPVALVLPTLGVGGTERHVVNLASALVRDEGQALVVAVGAPGPLRAEAERAGARVRVLGLAGPLDPRAVPRLAALFRAERPALVHAFLHGLDTVAALAARLAQVPRVLGSRREIAGWMATRHRLFQAAGTPLVDGIVCNALAVREHAARTEPGPLPGLIVLPNGVDLARFRLDAARRAQARKALGAGDGERLLVTVANLAPEKGHGVLLAAFAKLAAEFPRATLVLAGSGPLAASLELDAGRLAPGRVRFRGHEPDVAPLLAAADLFVLPSLSEGMPNALLEAMAAGVAPVATRAGGIPEVIEEGRSGLLVAAGSAPELADAMARLLAGDGLRARLALGARERVAAAFDLVAVEQRHLRLYRELRESAPRDRLYARPAGA